MRKAMRKATVAAVGAGFLVAASATAGRAGEGTVRAMSPWQAHGEAFLVAPGKLQFLGKFEGVLYLEEAGGDLDGALLLCPASQTVDLGTGAAEAKGHCILTSAKGEMVFSEWVCSGLAGKGCVGELRLTGGTGPFAGITGSGEMVVRTVLTAMAADLRSGEVVKGAAGLAVWPKLTYRTPDR